MKKLTGIFILMLWLFTWQSTVTAANWLFVQRLEGTRIGACNEYLDAESVVRRDGRVVYWTSWLYEKPFGKQQVLQVLWKKEARLDGQGQVRALEYYYYDQAGEKCSSILPLLCFHLWLIITLRSVPCTLQIMMAVC